MAHSLALLSQCSWPGKVQTRESTRPVLCTGCQCFVWKHDLTTFANNHNLIPVLAAPEPANVQRQDRTAVPRKTADFTLLRNLHMLSTILQTFERSTFGGVGVGALMNIETLHQSLYDCVRSTCKIPEHTVVHHQCCSNHAHVDCYYFGRTT